jgi:ferritin
MLSKTIQEAINRQIKHEIDSAYLYLAMSTHCTSRNLTGAAKWLRIQWQEELSHAMKLIDHVADRGGHVTLETIERPVSEYKTLLDLFQQVLTHEQSVTGLINRLYETAVKENDYATQTELQWFIREQIEEEKNASEIVEQIKMVGESGTTVFLLDRQLGMRAAR